MNEINDDNAAFPMSFHKDDRFSQGGMSLRDYFAGQALAGQIASLSNAEVVEKMKELCDAGAGSPFEWSARSAYQYADAMLKEREK